MAGNENEQNQTDAAKAAADAKAKAAADAKKKADAEANANAKAAQTQQTDATQTESDTENVSDPAAPTDDAAADRIAKLEAQIEQLLAAQQAPAPAPAAAPVQVQTILPHQAEVMRQREVAASGLRARKNKKNEVAPYSAVFTVPVIDPVQNRLLGWEKRNGKGEIVEEMTPVEG